MNKTIEQILSIEKDWYEDISNLFEKFVLCVSNAVIGENPSFNEIRDK